MKVLYVRISSLDQKTDRQRVQESEFNLVIEDKVSGSVPFFERQGGKMVLDLVEKGEIEELSVFQIDRLGRDVRDIVNTIHFFTKRQICISFISQGLKTLNPDKTENSISKMVINILGIVSEIERTQILERQRQGIDLAKAKGIYKGLDMTSAMKLRPAGFKFIRNTAIDLLITIPLVDGLYDSLKSTLKNKGIDITWGEKDGKILERIKEEVQINKI